MLDVGNLPTRKADKSRIEYLYDVFQTPSNRVDVVENGDDDRPHRPGQFYRSDPDLLFKHLDIIGTVLERQTNNTRTRKSNDGRGSIRAALMIVRFGNSPKKIRRKSMPFSNCGSDMSSLRCIDEYLTTPFRRSDWSHHSTTESQ